jgi:hypothetical protein
MLEPRIERCTGWRRAVTNTPTDEERTGPLRVTVVSDFI